jgi:hypothetical protein
VNDTVLDRMPKAARRESGPHSAPRAEPYPVIKPADKPTPLKASSKALAEKSSSDLNASSRNSGSTDKPASFLDVRLDDEDECGNIPVYDTCSGRLCSQQRHSCLVVSTDLGFYF